MNELTAGYNEAQPEPDTGEYLAFNPLNSDESEAAEKSAGSFIYGQTLGGLLERLQQKRGNAIAEVKYAESIQLSVPKLRLKDDSGELDLAYVLLEDCVLADQPAPDLDRQSFSTEVRPVSKRANQDVLKGAVITEDQRKSHLRAMKSLEGSLYAAKQALAKVEAEIAYIPNEIENRLGEMDEIIHGYKVTYQVDMDSESRNIFQQDIRHLRATRARCIKSPDGVMTWIMPHADMVVPLSMKHVTTPEPFSSLWDYRQ